MTEQNGASAGGPLRWVPGQQVRRASGRPVTLADLVAEGGQGRLFAVEESRDYLAKMYARPRDGLDVLVGAFEARGLRSSAATGVLLAPPRGVLLRDDASGAVGCLIPKLPRRSFDGLDLWAAHEAHTTSLDGRLHVARLVARAVAALNDNGIIVGDVKPENMWIHVDRRLLALIDLDSVTVLGRDGRPLHTTTAFTAEYRAPEVMIGQLPSTATDAFAVAVIVAQVLLGGVHPYARSRRHGGVNDDVSARISKTHSWLLDPDAYFLPEAHPGAAALGPELAALFEDAVTAAERPSAARWVAALDELEVTRCREGHEVLPGATCPLHPSVAAAPAAARRAAADPAAVWSATAAGDTDPAPPSDGGEAGVRRQRRVVGAKRAGGDHRRSGGLARAETAATTVPVLVVLVAATAGGAGLAGLVRALAAVLVVVYAVLGARSLVRGGFSREVGWSALAALGSLLALLVTL